MLNFVGRLLVAPEVSLCTTSSTNGVHQIRSTAGVRGAPDQKHWYCNRFESESHSDSVSQLSPNGLIWLAFVMMKMTSTTTVMADYCLVGLWGGEVDDYSHSDDSSLVGLWGGRVHLCSLFHRDLSHRIDPPLLSRIADLHSLQIIIGQYEFA